MKRVLGGFNVLFVARTAFGTDSFRLSPIGSST
jgi:hypothetical protein